MSDFRILAQILWVCLLIPVNVGNSKIVIGRDGGVFTDGQTYSVDNHGKTLFGLSTADESHADLCGRSDIKRRDQLKTICVANLYRLYGMPQITDATSTIGFHTVFEAQCESNSTPTRLRFVSEVEEFSGIPPKSYYFALSDTFFVLCVTGSNPTESFKNIKFYMNADFFTDLKVHVGSGLRTDPCLKPTANPNKLSVYFALTDSQNCDRDYKGYFGIRVKPNGVDGVYKSVEVDIAPKGSYGDENKKDHFYYIEETDLRPLLEAAKCTVVCKHKTLETMYCKGYTLCGADFTTMHYDGTEIFRNLIADYAYLTHSNQPAICSELHKYDTGVYATSNIIFDESLNGQPRCDCADEYGWNIKIQVCKLCVNDSSLHGCSNTTNSPDPSNSCDPGYVLDPKSETCVNTDPMLCLC